MEQVAKFLVSFGYLGYSPYAPGTMGTLGAAACYAVAWKLGWVNMHTLVFALVAVSILTWWLGSWAEQYWHKKDPSRVVLDEVAGFLVSVMLLQPSWWVIAGGVVLFRLFDICKPYPIRLLEEWPGGLGILCDDLLAGVYAQLVLLAVSWFTHTMHFAVQLPPALWNW